MSYKRERKEENVIPNAALTVSADEVLDGTRDKILVNGPAFSPGFSPDEKSVDFNDNESMISSSGTFGLANTWSWSAWVKATGEPTSGGESLFFYLSDSSAASSNNTIMLSNRKFNFDPSQWRVFIRGNSGNIKRYEFPDNTVLNQWYNLTVTWSGGVLTLYEDGAVVTPEISTDQASVMIDQSGRSMRMSREASNAFGRIHSVAFWDVALGSSEVASIYNTGSASQADLAIDFGSYASSANLQHWYRMGFAQLPDIGKDYGVGSAALKDMSTLGSDDIVWIIHVNQNQAGVEAAIDVIHDKSIVVDVICICSSNQCVLKLKSILLTQLVPFVTMKCSG